jgi:hypothetical protein
MSWRGQPHLVRVSCACPAAASMDGSRPSFGIRVVGSLGPAARYAFTDVAIEVEPAATVLWGDLDQAGLHVLLDRVRALGLELMDIREVPEQSSG